MCGIFGVVSSKAVANNLVAGLKRLEYRGYDSAGISVINKNEKLKRIRCKGKVSDLKKLLRSHSLDGKCGIAHTRWATHGIPNIKNAHPHNSGCISIVHNGIIENHEELKRNLKKKGYVFSSDTDSEIISHLIHSNTTNKKTFVKTILDSVKLLKGTYALGIINEHYPNRIIATSHGSPLLIGLGNTENYIGSDIQPISPQTKKFITLNDFEIADISATDVSVYDKKGRKIKKSLNHSSLKAKDISKSGYKHFMQKEIHEQKDIVGNIINNYLSTTKVLPNTFGPKSDQLLKQIKNIHFVACGTSFNASLVAKNWIEELTNITCTAEIASEYRHRQINVPKDTLYVAISQSGENADTVYSTKKAKTLSYKSILSICNVPESSLTRLSDFIFLTRAGPEISVASTKAFTSQLISLLLLVCVLCRYTGNSKLEKSIVKEIKTLPRVLKEIYKLESEMKSIAKHFKRKHHTLFLGRGTSYPIALEAALKLKEISYIHAEGYAAGELKHGPLALVDKDMPVIGLMPENHLVNQVLSNLAEVKARQGLVYIFTNKKLKLKKGDNTKIIKMPSCGHFIAPLAYVIPMQLLAYYVAINKKTNIDQPRNLAKSVTVE